MRGYHFTERVRRVLAAAREEAGKLNHEYVGTEHILLGLLRQGDSTGLDILRRLDIDPEVVARHLLQTIHPGRSRSPVGPDLPYTSRAKAALEQALSEVRELNHAYVGTEHLLLGLIREGRGLAAQALGAAGVALDAARSELKRIVAAETGENRPPATEESPGPAGRALDHAEVILQYRDGGRIHSKFVSIRDAIGFLDRIERQRWQ